MGVAFRDMGSIVESIECYDRCLQLCPTGRNAAHTWLVVGYQ